MKKLLVANFKMNGNKDFYQKVNKVVNKIAVKDTVVLCPPFVYMPYFKIKNKNVFIGTQDMAGFENGKSTGQISPNMLKDFDVTYSILGHSERRAIGETNEIVAQKVKHAIDNNIIPIICVGGKTKLDEIVEQVEAVLSSVENNNKIFFAYEPISAIGTGIQPSVNQINIRLKLIKETAKKHGFDVGVLYGGSVNMSNIREMNKTIAEGYLMGTVTKNIDELMEIFKGDYE